ncbi:MAG: agmatine deiminase family protein [Bdellovibrionales bacterium]|nr:agmatine deiminase family protein [Bdellovibrionales bacterium]
MKILFISILMFIAPAASSQGLDPILASSQALSRSPLPQGASAELLQQISAHNQNQAILFQPTESEQNLRPFAEYETTGYVVFSDGEFSGYATEIKKRIAEELDPSVTLIIYTQSTDKNYQRSLFNKYSQYIPQDRLKIMEVPESGRNDFWSRDNLPLPVWNSDKMNLVDARYYYNFEPDEFFANAFSVALSHHNFFFEGGNFIVNALGDCIVVNRRRSYPGGTSDTAAIPDSVFHNQYGCSNLIRLKHLKGIGHADEVVKFLSDKVVVTDTEAYVSILEQQGFEVHLLPEPDRDYETYANSLQVNQTLFIPSFGESGDQEALDLFQQLLPGYKIVALPTRRLATGGQGGIHCITMNYPDVPLQEFVESFSGRLLSFHSQK